MVVWLWIGGGIMALGAALALVAGAPAPAVARRSRPPNRSLKSPSSSKPRTVEGTRAEGALDRARRRRIVVVVLGVVLALNVSGSDASSRFTRTGSAVCAAGSSTPAPVTRPGPHWRRRWRRSRRHLRAGLLVPGWRPATARCASLLRPGDHVVIPDDAYGGTFRLIDKVFTQWGVQHTPVALSDLDAVARR